MGILPIAGEEGAGAAHGLDDLGLGRVLLDLAPDIVRDPAGAVAEQRGDLAAVHPALATE